MTIKISLKSLSGQFNDLYPERPIWAHISTGTTASTNQPVVALYGESSIYHSLAVESGSANARSRGRGFSDEMANSNYTFYGNTSAAAATSNVTPNSGVVGITSAGAQTAGLAHFDIYDNGNYGWYNAFANSNGSFSVAQASAPIVGEENWRQVFDLVLSGGKIYKEGIGGQLISVTGANRNYIDLASQSTLGGDYTPHSNWTGVGQMSYNRNTRRLMVAQCIAGVNATSLTFRIHLFDLQLLIGRKTTIAEIQAAMVASVAAGANRYRYVNVVCPSTTVYYSALGQSETALTKFVLCDNDEIWAFKSSDSAINGAAYVNCLWRINLSGGNWFTGAYTASVAITMANTSVYGGTTSPVLSPKHMNSDDNSVIAIYQHAYHYSSGANIAFLSTKNAGPTSFNHFAENNGLYQNSIAPTGGPNFVITRCGTSSNVNLDGIGSYLAHLDNTKLAGTSLVGASYLGGFYPVMASSTCYGVSNVVMKVQPTSEWK